MRLYLDLNCFNRPFDDQNQARIVQETAAVFSILQRIVDGVDHLMWSVILDFENAQHPLADRRVEIARWAHRAVGHLVITPNVAAFRDAVIKAVPPKFESRWGKGTFERLQSLA